MAWILIFMSWKLGHTVSNMMHALSNTVTTVKQTLVPENNFDAPRCIAHLWLVPIVIGRTKELLKCIKVRMRNAVISNVRDGVDGQEVEGQWVRRMVGWRQWNVRWREDGWSWWEVGRWWDEWQCEI